jgi:xanthine dehydrogenase accessory factor
VLKRNCEESALLGLPCGGQMKVLVEQITNTKLSNYQKHIDDILFNIEKHHCIRRNVSLPEGEISLLASTPEQRLTSCIALSENSFSHVLGTAFKLIIIGANQVSQYLAEFAIALNYRVMICDPRPEAIRSLNLRYVEIFQKMPDDFILDQKPDKQCAIVTVTDDPKIDDLALIKALASNAFYVGAMGSERPLKHDMID